MSKQAKHTPGPWLGAARTVSGNGYSVHVTDTKYEIIASVGTHDFNVSNSHNPAKDFDSAQINANARLIAAAPDLLAACEAMHRLLLGTVIAADAHLTMNAARAAIAMAKGVATGQLEVCGDCGYTTVGGVCSAKCRLAKGGVA